MTATTDTLTRPDETAGRETTSPPEAPRPSTSRRAAYGWIAVILALIAVAAITFAAFTGGDDGVVVRTVPFDPQVEQWEREAHLEGNARTYSTPAVSTDDDEFLPGSRHLPTQ